MYLSKLPNVFVQRTFSFDAIIRSLERSWWGCHDLSYESHFVFFCPTCKMYLSNLAFKSQFLLINLLSNGFIQIGKCICPNCKMHLSKLLNVFVQIYISILEAINRSLWRSWRCFYDLSYESHFVLQRSRHKSRHHQHTNNQQNYCQRIKKQFNHGQGSEHLAFGCPSELCLKLTLNFYV